MTPANRLSLVFVLFLACLVAAPRAETANPEEGRLHVLIISIADYVNQPPIAFARSDARALAAAFVRALGADPADVVVMDDGQGVTSEPYPSLVRMMAAIRKIAADARPADAVVVCFIGQGAEVEGRGRLVPADGNPLLSGTLLPLDWVRDTLERSAARRRLLILDPRRFPAGQNPMEAILGATGDSPVPALVSCGMDQTSHEEAGIGRGVFVHALIEGLSGRADRYVEGNADGHVSLQELFSWSSQILREWSQKENPEQSPGLCGKPSSTVVFRLRLTPEAWAETFVDRLVWSEKPEERRLIVDGREMSPGNPIPGSPDTVIASLNADGMVVKTGDREQTVPFRSGLALVEPSASETPAPAVTEPPSEEGTVLKGVIWSDKAEDRMALVGEDIVKEGQPLPGRPGAILKKILQNSVEIEQDGKTEVLSVE